MGSPIPTQTPQGAVVALGIPNSQDYPRLVLTSPYFEGVPLAELIEPSVIEAVNNVLPSLVPPYVDQAAQAAVQQLAVLLTGSTMTGPLFLNPLMPTADAQAATKAYVDTMLSTAGIPEVPPVPSGQVWARETGQWVPISQTGGTFLPIAGGTMQGNIAMSGNTITNMAAVPAMPNGAAPAQWVLNQIASVSLYQGTWNADTNVPDLTQLSTHVNAYTWIALTTSPSGVVIGPAIPGLQGTTVFNGDTIIYSTVEGQFKAIHGGGITLPEADGRYVQLAGSQMSGALLLNANATQPLQATTLQQLDAAVANTVTPDAPADGQGYLRVGVGAPVARWVPGLPLAGGILTGALTLAANAATALQAVPLQQMNSAITAATAGFLPLAGGAMTGLMQLSGNATVNLNPVPLQQLNAMLQTYAPLANPAFSGVPTVPLAAPGTNTGQAASTAFVQAATGNYLPLSGGTLTGALVLPNGTSAAPALNFAGNGGFYVSSPNLVAFTQSLNVAGSVSATAGVNGGPGTIGGVILNTNVTLPANGALIFHTSQISSIIFDTNYSLQYRNTDGTWHFISPTGNAMSLDFAGNMTVNSLTQTSDERTKGNIAAYAPGVSIIGQLMPKTFTYNSDTASPQVMHLGFMAQDVQPVLPEAVSGSLDTMLGLDTTPVIAALVNAVKQLISRIQALESNANITPSAAETA